MTKNIVRFAPLALCLSLVVLALVQPAYAQTSSNFNQQDFGSLALGLFKPSTGTGFFQVLGIVLNFFLLIAGLAAFFYILYGGFLYLTAGGDAARATQGRTYIVNAIIGAVIVFISFALARYVINFTQTGNTGATNSTSQFQ